MNDKIVVEEPDSTRGTIGAHEPVWTTHVTSWADITNISGNENFTTDMVIYSDTKQFIIHYNEGQNVTSKMRINYNSQYFYITSVNHEKRLKTRLVAVAKDDDAGPS
jgi:SPP1 family predicted phage head-tail adaptor